MKTHAILILLLLLSRIVPAQTTDKKNEPVKDTTKTIDKNIDLKEVVIKSRRPLIQLETDRTIVHVDAMLGSASSNTLEVLEKTPGVTVNASGDISLNGRGGVLVLIDGRPTYMSGPDLGSYLKSLPGGSLDKIELMDNPPARYDASGSAIINLRLKKNRSGGITGGLTTGYTQGRYARNNSSLNLNYNHKKINLFANTGYGHERSYTTDVYNRSYFDPSAVLTSKVLLNNDQDYKNNGVSSNIGMDYAATENTTYGAQFNISQNRRNDSFNSYSSNYSPGQLDSTGKGFTSGTDKRTNLMANLNFQHKFGKTGRELSADANYLRYTGRGDQSLQNLVSAGNGNAVSSSEFLYHLPSDMDIYTIKSDYLHPLKNRARIEAGFKWSTVSNDNKSDYYLVDGLEQRIDNGRSNHFLYRENFTAAYITAQKAWKQLGIQAGLRAEHTFAAGDQLGNAVVAASSFSKNYTRFFPSLYISYKLDTLSKNTLVFSLTRRINRPNYQMLNPFVFYRDQYSYTSGNPDLNSQYQYRYELKYQYRQMLTMTLSYNHFTDIIFQTTNVVDDIFITKPENVTAGYMLLLNTGLSLSPANWWNFHADILLSRIGLDGRAYGERLNPETYVARINVLNQLQFDHGWSAEAGAYYASRDLNGQTFTAGMIRANAGLQKKIFHDKGSIRLSMDDIFHSWKYENRSVALKQAYYYQTSVSDTQRIGLAFTYNFGNELFKRKSRHRDNALDEEKQRM